MRPLRWYREKGVHKSFLAPNGLDCYSSGVTPEIRPENFWHTELKGIDACTFSSFSLFHYVIFRVHTGCRVPKGTILKSIFYVKDQFLSWSGETGRSSTLLLLTLEHHRCLSDIWQFNRIWRWEVGGGPITIGRSLHIERNGCRSGLWVDVVTNIDGYKKENDNNETCRAINK